MVVSNATAAICEINLARSDPIFEFTGRNVTPVLNAMASCTEWCQTILFDALSKYVPENAEDASNLIFRLIPFLRHSNPAVVIGSFKCIFIFLEKDNRPPHEVFPTILPPFLTLVTNDNIEIQYIVLRTLNLFAQKYPKALAKEIRIFFCKYNDPTYVKSEKLGIITANCGPSNAALVLDELAEYCNSVDVDFVRRSVKSIGEIAIKFESCAAKCVDILVALVEGKAGYAVEQAVIVLSDILRKFPGRFEGIIEKVCPNLDQVKDPQARAAGIWILGEYCGLIDKVDVILDPFLDTFPDEPPIVQLQLISSIVKVYLSKPDETREQLQFVLNEATKQTMPPDIRNRALIYWRMLSLSSDAAKQFIQFQKVGVEHSGQQFPDEVLHELFANMGLVAGVLHILPSQFVVQSKSGELGTDDSGHNWKPLAFLRPSNVVAIYSDWSPNQWALQIMNKRDHTLSNFALAVNANGSGFAIIGGVQFPQSLDATEVCEIAIPFAFKSETIDVQKSAFELDFALRTSDGIQYFRDTIDTRRVFGRTSLTTDNFGGFITQHAEAFTFDVENGKLADVQELRRRGLTVLARGSGIVTVGFSIAGKEVLGQLEVKEEGVFVTLRGEKAFFQLVKESAKYTFCRD
jgi:hypothetical protein